MNRRNMAPSPAKERTHCIRCGGCCRTSSPTLQTADLPHVKDGFIRREDLYTIRPGELIRDNVQGGLKPAAHELIKIRDRDGACVYYEETQKKCRIYTHRPVQCAAQKCWDDREFMRVYAEPKAVRKDLINDPNLLRLMAAHERRCAVNDLEDWVERIEHEGEAAVMTILKMLKFDHDLRRMMPERLRMDPRELDLVLGRPLTKIIEVFGLRVDKTSDGSFFLTVRQP
jgi:Fe-S-cluster containining protein